MTVSCSFVDAGFIAGIKGTNVPGPFHFDEEILNPGGHFFASDGSYVVPYPGLYQFTIAFKGRNDEELKIYLEVDGAVKGYAKHEDGTVDSNSVMLTTNLHLEAGQVITVDVHEINGVYGEKDGIPGSYSWFTGHLIYAD